MSAASKPPPGGLAPLAERGTRGELEEEADARERSEEGGAKAGPAVRSGERLMVFWDSFSCPLGESDDDDPKALDQMALRLRFRLQTLAAAAGCTLRAYAGEGGWLGDAVKRGVFGESTTLVPCANAVEASGALLCDLLCETYDAWYERGASAPATLLVTSSPELAAAAHHMALRGLDVTLAAPPPAAAGEPAARRAPGVSGSGVETPVVGGMRAAYSWPKLYRTVGAEEKGAAEEAARRTLGARGRHEISQLFSQTAVAKVVSRSRSIDPTTLRLESSAAEARADAAAMVRVAQREVEEAARRAATAEARAASAEAAADKAEARVKRVQQTAKERTRAEEGRRGAAQQESGKRDEEARGLRAQLTELETRLADEAARANAAEARAAAADERAAEAEQGMSTMEAAFAAVVVEQTTQQRLAAAEQSDRQVLA